MVASLKKKKSMNHLHENNSKKVSLLNYYLDTKFGPDSWTTFSETLGLVLGLRGENQANTQYIEQDDHFHSSENQIIISHTENSIDSNRAPLELEPYPNFMNDATSTESNETFKDSLNQVNSINGISIHDIELLYSAGLIQGLSQPQRFSKELDDSHIKSAITMANSISTNSMSNMNNSIMNSHSISGTMDGSIDGAMDGAMDGTIDGTMNGDIDGTIESTINSAIEGTIEEYSQIHDSVVSTAITAAAGDRRTSMEFDPIALEREHQKVMEALAAVYASQSYCSTSTSNHDPSSNSITIVHDDQYLPSESKPLKKRLYKKSKDHDTSSNNEAEAICPLCDGSYKNKSSLSSHMKTHDIERKKFVCSVCQTCFSRNHGNHYILHCVRSNLYQ
jgi:hypothetical protein